MDRPLATRTHIGLVLAALLGAVDVSSSFMLPDPSSDAIGPPASVLVFTGVMGVVTLAAVAVAWVRRRRAALRLTARSRVLSALTSLPAFFVPDVPTLFVAVATGSIVLTFLDVWLLLARSAVTAGAEPRVAPAAR